MALVELVTNLENFYYYQSKGYVGGLGNFSAKTHPYGQDQPGGGSSGQPYIQVPIPQVGPADLFVSLPGKDYLLRGGGDYLSTVSTNLQRISRFVDDPNNPAFGLFLTKQKELYKQQSKLPSTIKPELAYDAKNLFINLAGGFNGLHERGKGLSSLPGLDLNSPLEPQLASLALAGRVQGSLFDPVSSYEYQTRYVYNNVQQRPVGGGTGFFQSTGNFFANTNTSRLGLLWSLKINNTVPGGLGLATAKAFNIAILNNESLFKYAEGPNGPLEIYHRATDTTTWSEDSGGSIQIGSAPQVGGNNAYFNVLTSKNLNKYSTQFGFADNPVTTVYDFREYLQFYQPQAKASPAAKTLTYTDYSKFNRETTYGLNSPGKEGLNRSKPVSSLSPLNSDGVASNTYDLISLSPIYSSDTGVNKTLANSDIVPFYITVLDLNGTNKNNYIHFRAYVKGISDEYSADWASFKYTGRGENFYTYNGFNRSMGLNFSVFAASKSEQKSMYQKLNYLASLLAPNYSSIGGNNSGFMRGNIIKLTIGDYLVNQPGIIQGLSFSIPDESPWDLGRNEDGEKKDPSESLSLNLPHLIEVQGFKFTPIHSFLPKTLNQEWIDNPNSSTTVFDTPYINMGVDSLSKTINNNHFKQRVL